ncbi:MAG: hypothetical protein H0X37_02815 [Herpetosiphonaceae bacterium]|nr:hypothetical protein [Herpetosiphonaceae bacterium]
MPALKVDRLGIEAFVRMAQRSEYHQHDNMHYYLNPVVPATPHRIATLDWQSYTDEQIQGLVVMCSDVKARVAAKFESDVYAEAARRNLDLPDCDISA